MKKLSADTKETIVKKTLGLKSKEIRIIAQQNNVGFSTLQKWRKKYNLTSSVSECKQQVNGKINRKDKLHHILATTTLNSHDIGVYCRENGLYAIQLEEWKNELMRESDDQKYQALLNENRQLRAENKELKNDVNRKNKALAEASALLVLKKKSGFDLGGSRGRLILTSDKNNAIELIKEACNSGARKRKACETLGLSLRTLERWENAGMLDKRKGAEKVIKNKLTQEERDMIVTVANSKKYQDLPPCKIVPSLADEKVYIASESSFYRTLRTAKQLTHRGHAKQKKHNRPKQFIANTPNQVWTWDISYLPSQITGSYYYLYLVMDIYSRKIVGWSIHEEESSKNASCLIQQACIDEGVGLNQIVLHSDNGSPMKGMTMLAMLEKLGVLPSFSRPSVSNDNPYSESLFKTIKYHPTFPAFEKFSDIKAARLWCEKFSNWYNNNHLHSGIKFITPNQRHNGDDKTIMANRHKVYQDAKKRHPERWARNTRNWILPEAVTLNPAKARDTIGVTAKAISTYPHEQDHSKNPAIVDKCGRLTVLT